MHAPLTQSRPSAHAFPLAHFGHAPPQSVAVSLPSFVPLLQAVAVQVPALQ